jgi:hypothetical protein
VSHRPQVACLDHAFGLLVVARPTAAAVAAAAAAEGLFSVEPPPELFGRLTDLCGALADELATAILLKHMQARRGRLMR